MKTHLIKYNIPVYNELKQILQIANSAAIIQEENVDINAVVLHYIKHHNLKHITIVTPTAIKKAKWKQDIKSITNAEIAIYTQNNSHDRFNLRKSNTGNKTDLLIIDGMQETSGGYWSDTSETFWSKDIPKIIKKLSDRNKKTIALTNTPVGNLETGINVITETFSNNWIASVNIKETTIDDILPPFKFEYVKDLYDITEQITNIKRDISQSKQIPNKEKDQYIKMLKVIELSDKHATNIKNILDKHLNMNETQKIILFTKDTRVKTDLQKHLINWYPKANIYDVDVDTNNYNQTINSFNIANTGVNIIITSDDDNTDINVSNITGIITHREKPEDIRFLQTLGSKLTSKCHNKIVILDLVNNLKQIRNEHGVIDFIDFINNNEIPNYKTNIITDHTVNRVITINMINDAIRKIWSDDENNIIKKHFNDKNIDITKRLTGRSINECIRQAKLLGVYNYKTNKQKDIWTTDEDLIIDTYFANEGFAVARRLPNKSTIDCIKRADFRGITITNASSNYKYAQLTDVNKILRKWGPTDMVYANKLISGGNIGTTTERAKKLGVIKIPTSWSVNEINILEKWYAKEGGNVALRLNGKTRTNCMSKASELNINLFDDRSSEIKMITLNNTLRFKNSKEAADYLKSFNIDNVNNKSKNNIISHINLAIKQKNIKFNAIWEKIK